ncbi:MAG: endonuclease/exonuclease/phosphatase family protein [Xanthomonadales bacterium]|nr:endonuclease/exonuclease/phosphatase family protein [Xanthomonadales bacterium]
MRPAIALLVLVMLAWQPACSAATRPGAAPTITAVTLNLWHDKADWPTRRAAIVEGLRRLRPDVIALQEVLQHEALPNQARALARDLGYRVVFASVDSASATRRYGNAILTRHPILAEDWRKLRPWDDWRIAVHVRIAIHRRALDVYATHLHHTTAGGAIRARQIGDLTAFVDATARGDAAVLLGDFNAAFDAPELAALRARWQDAYDRMHPDAAQDVAAHSTLNPALLPPLRVDHVLFDPARMDAVSTRRLFDTPLADGQWASDHFGILATLRWRD